MKMKSFFFLKSFELAQGVILKIKNSMGKAHKVFF
jgi:hypothetical protein